MVVIEDVYNQLTIHVVYSVKQNSIQGHALHQGNISLKYYFFFNKTQNNTAANQFCCNY